MSTAQAARIKDFRAMLRRVAGEQRLPHEARPGSVSCAHCFQPSVLWEGGNRDCPVRRERANRIL